MLIPITGIIANIPKPTMSGVIPINANARSRYPVPSRPRPPPRTKLPPTDDMADAMSKLVADADGFNDILNELSQVHRHMAVLLRRIRHSTGQLSLGEIQQQDLDRKLNELKAKKMGEIEGNLIRLMTIHKDTWREIDQLSQGINAALDTARGVEGDEVSHQRHRLR